MKKVTICTVFLLLILVQSSNRRRVPIQDHRRARRSAYRGVRD